MKREVVRGLIEVDNKLAVLFRRKNGKEYYSVPGGGIEKGETKESALHRELFEELNINVEINKYLFTYETKKQIEYFYLCKYISGSFTLNGEEKDRNCDTNFYEPTFISIKDINNFDILQIVKDYYNN